MLRLVPEHVRRQGPGNILAVCWRQFWTERALRARGVEFRTTDPALAAAAYAAMSDAEFEAINGRQAWANWRTIPRAMDGHVPDRPLVVVDLGCGSGPSTQVLAFCAPPGSRILGYEIAQPLVDLARRRRYRDRTGGTATVEFVCQGVTEPLNDSGGVRLADGTVDLVNASGVVGHHLTASTIGPLLDELARLLAPDGTAMLDVGPTMEERDLTDLMAAREFLPRGRYRSCPIDFTGEVVFRRR